MHHTGLNNNPLGKKTALPAFGEIIKTYPKPIVERDDLPVNHEEIASFSLVEELLSVAFNCPELDKKSFVHIHCSRTAEDTGYTGQSAEIPLLILQKVLKFGQSFQKLVFFTEVEAKRAEDAATSALKEKKTIKDLSKLYVKSDRSDFHKQLALDSSKIAKRLSEGKKWTVPVGPNAHAMFLVIERNKVNDYSIYLYNAQKGSEKLQGGILEGNTIKVAPFYAFDQVESSELFYQDDKGGFHSDLIAHILTLSAIKASGTSDISIESNDIINCFSHVFHRQVSAKSKIDHFIRFQRSGTCTQKSLNALLLHEYDTSHHLFKRLTVLSRFYTLLAFYKQNCGNLDDPKLQVELFLLQEGLENLIIAVKKCCRAGCENQILTHAQAKYVIATALDLQGRLFDHEKTQKRVSEDLEKLTTIKLKQFEENQALSRGRRALQLNQAPALKSSRLSRKGGVAVLPTSTPKSLLELIEVVKNLSPLSVSCKKGEDLTDLDYALSGFVSQVQTLPVPKRSKTTLWSELSIRQANNIITSLTKSYINFVHGLQKKGVVINEKRLVALFHLYACIHFLAIKIDGEYPSKVLENYSLDISLFENIFQRDAYIAFYNATTFSHWKEVKRYFGEFSGRAIFNWQNTSIDEIKEHKLGFYKELYHRCTENQKHRIDYRRNDFRSFLISMNKIFTNEEIAAFSLLVEYKKEKDSFFYQEKISKNPVRFNFGSNLNQAAPHILQLKRASLFTHLLLDARSELDDRNCGDYLRIQAQLLPNYLCITFGFHLLRAGERRPLSPRHCQSTDIDFAGNNVLSSQSRSSQNEVLSKNSISILSEPSLSEAVSDVGVLVPNLMMMMFENIDLLLSREKRIFFELLFFKPTRSRNGEELIVPFIQQIKCRPKVTLDLFRRLIHHGTERFFKKGRLEKDEIAALVFILQLAQKATSVHREMHGIDPEKPLYDYKIFEELLKEISSLEDENQVKCNWIVLTRMHHFKAFDIFQSFNRVLWTQFAADLFHLKESNISEIRFSVYSDKQLEAVAFHTIYFQKNILKDFELHPEHIEGFAIQLLYNLGFKQEIGFTWNLDCKKKEILLIGKKGDEFWKIDFAKFEVQNQKGIVSTGQNELVKRQIWKKIFAEKEHSFTRVGEIHKTEDSLYGPLRILKKGTIERQIDGVWYTCLSLKRRFLDFALPQALCFNHSHWIARDGRCEFPLLICNLLTGKPEYAQNQDGQLVEVFVPSDWNEQYSGIKRKGKHVVLRKYSENAFDSLNGSGEYFLLSMEGKEEISEGAKAIFPRMQLSTGEPLSFIFLDGAWVLMSNPSLMLSETQHKNLCSYHRQYLELIHSESGEKALLFIQPSLIDKEEEVSKIESEGYSSKIKIILPKTKCLFRNELVTVRIIKYNNYRPVGLTLEDSLFLAWQDLAAKNYTCAMSRLKSMDQGRPLSNESEKLVKKIICSESACHDFSPEGSAVRLQAYWVLHNSKLEPISLLKISKMRSPADLYNLYLDGLSKMPADLKFSNEKELKILKALKLSYKFDDRGRGKLLEGKIPLSEYLPWKRSWDSNLLVVKQKRVWERVLPIIQFESCKLPSKVTYTQPLRFGDKLDLDAFLYLYKRLKECENNSEKLSLLYAIEHHKNPPGIKEDLRLKYLLYFVAQNQALAPKMSVYFEDYSTERENWFRSLIQAYNANAYTLTKSPEFNPIHPNARFVLSQEPEKKDDAGESKTTPVSALLPKIPADRVLEIFQKNYVKPLPKQEPEKLPPIEKPKKETFSKEDQLHLNGVEAEFDLMNKELVEAVKNEKKEDHYEFGAGRSIDTFYNDLTKSLGILKGRLEKKEKFVTDKAIVGSIEHPDILAEENARTGKTIRIWDLARASICKTKEGYKRLNRHLSDDTIEELHIDVVQFMMEKTAYYQLKRAHKFLSKAKSASNPKERKAYLEQAFQALMQKRTYKVDTVEELNSNIYSLYFEFVAKLRVRVGQAQILTELKERVLGGKLLCDVLFQMMVGAGKTSVIIPILLDLIAESGLLAVLILDPTQYKGVLGNIIEYQMKRYRKRIVEIDYTRDQLQSHGNLKKILDKLETALREKNSVSMKSTMVQIFLLELKDSVEKFSTKSSFKDKLRIAYLGKILKLLREKGVFVTDEAHLVYEIKKQLNNAKGLEKFLSQEEMGLISQIYIDLEASCNVQFHKDMPPISKQTYENSIQETLISCIAAYLQIPKVHRNAYRRFVLETMGEWIDEKKRGSIQIAAIKNELPSKILDFVKGAVGEAELLKKHPDKWLKKLKMPEGYDIAKWKEELRLCKELWEDWAYMRYLHKELGGSTEADIEKAGIQALSRYLLSTVVPGVLARSPGRHFGRLSDGSGKVVPLTKGIRTSSKTEFANPYEAACAHFLCAAMSGVSEKQIEAVAIALAKIADTKAQFSGSFSETVEAKDFEQVTGVSLSVARKRMDLGKALKKVNQDLESKIAFESFSATLFATFHDECSSALSYDISESSKANIACSGTIDNRKTYSFRFKKPIKDKGALGKICRCLLKMVVRGQSTIRQLTNASTTELFEKIKGAKDSAKIRALMDSAGLFSQKEGIDFAKEYLTFFKDDPTRNSILFFYEGSFAILKKNSKGEIDAEPTPIPNTTIDAITDAKAKPEELFVFFREADCTGVDVDLPIDCKGWLTVDPDSQTFSAIAQSVARLRLLWYGQTVDYLLLEEKTKVYGTKKLTIPMILERSIALQGIMKSKELIRSLLEKIPHASKSVVQEKLIKIAAKGIKIEIQAFREGYKRYLRHSTHVSLLKRFGNLSIAVNTYNYLTELIDTEKANFIKKDPLELEDLVEEKFETIRKQAEKQITKKCIPYTTQRSSHTHTMGTEATVEQENTVTVESTVTKETTTELQNSVLAYQTKGLRSSIEQFWVNLQNLFGQMPGELNGVTTYTIYKYLYRTTGLYLDKRFNFKDAFPKNLQLYFSDNFTKTMQMYTTVFSASHKRIHTLLICKDPKSKKLKFLALTNKDYGQWQKFIEEKRLKNYWIISVEGHRLCGESKKDLETGIYKLPQSILEDQEFQKTLWFANFFNGSVRYLTKHEALTAELMNEPGKNRIRLQFLKLRHAFNPTTVQMLVQSPVFNGEQSGKTSGPSFLKRKEDESKWVEQIKEMSDDDMRNIRPSGVPTLAKLFPTKLPLLERRTQIQNVPAKEEFVNGLTPKQILNLNDSQIGVLTNKKLIEKLSDEKLHLLSEKGVLQLSEKQVKRLQAVRDRRILSLLSEKQLVSLPVDAIQAIRDGSTLALKYPLSRYNDLVKEQWEILGKRAKISSRTVEMVQKLSIDELKKLPDRLFNKMSDSQFKDIKNTNDAESIIRLDGGVWGPKLGLDQWNCMKNLTIRFQSQLALFVQRADLNRKSYIPPYFQHFAKAPYIQALEYRALLNLPEYYAKYFSTPQWNNILSDVSISEEKKASLISNLTMKSIQNYFPKPELKRIDFDKIDVTNWGQEDVEAIPESHRLLLSKLSDDQLQHLSSGQLRWANLEILKKIKLLKTAERVPKHRRNFLDEDLQEKMLKKRAATFETCSDWGGFDKSVLKKFSQTLSNNHLKKLSEKDHIYLILSIIKSELESDHPRWSIIPVTVLRNYCSRIHKKKIRKIKSDIGKHKILFQQIPIYVVLNKFTDENLKYLGDWQIANIELRRVNDLYLHLSPTQRRVLSKAQLKELYNAKIKVINDPVIAAKIDSNKRRFLTDPMQQAVLKERLNGDFKDCSDWSGFKKSLLKSFVEGLSEDRVNELSSRNHQPLVKYLTKEQFKWVMDDTIFTKIDRYDLNTAEKVPISKRGKLNSLLQIEMLQKRFFQEDFATNTDWEGFLNFNITAALNWDQYFNAKVIKNLSPVYHIRLIQNLEPKTFIIYLQESCYETLTENQIKTIKIPKNYTENSNYGKFFNSLSDEKLQWIDPKQVDKLHDKAFERVADPKLLISVPVRERYRLTEDQCLSIFKYKLANNFAIDSDWSSYRSGVFKKFVEKLEPEWIEKMNSKCHKKLFNYLTKDQWVIFGSLQGNAVHVPTDKRDLFNDIWQVDLLDELLKEGAAEYEGFRDSALKSFANELEDDAVRGLKEKHAKLIKFIPIDKMVRLGTRSNTQGLSRQQIQSLTKEHHDNRPNFFQLLKPAQINEFTAPQLVWLGDDLIAKITNRVTAEQVPVNRRSQLTPGMQSAVLIAKKNQQNFAQDNDWNEFSENAITQFVQNSLEDRNLGQLTAQNHSRLIGRVRDNRLKLLPKDKDVISLVPFEKERYLSVRQLNAKYYSSLGEGIKSFAKGSFLAAISPIELVAGVSFQLIALTWKGIQRVADRRSEEKKRAFKRQAYRTGAAFAKPWCNLVAPFSYSAYRKWSSSLQVA